MNKVILCEGATDAILLSYYMQTCYGWQYCRKMPENLTIRIEEGNQTSNCYMKGDDRLLICAVGGKNNFSNFFTNYIMNPLVHGNAFDTMVVITDCDDRIKREIEQEMQGTFSGIVTNFKEGCWCKNEYIDAYKMQKTIRSLLIIMPKEHQGALETVMLEAIAEDTYDANIVAASGEFVHQMRKIAEKYIPTDRIEMKARLGVTWAIQYPEKVFSRIDEQIRNVSWEKSEILKIHFSILENI